MYKKILVPLDGSRLAETALEHAEALAKRFDSQLVLVRVRESVPVPVMPEMAVPPLTPTGQLEQEAVAYLDKITGKLRQRGLSSLSLVLDGVVSENIVDAAEAQGIDLIVMSTHGRSGLSRWIFGSVASKVLQGATCPVLVVRSRT